MFYEILFVYDGVFGKIFLTKSQIYFVKIVQICLLIHPVKAIEILKIIRKWVSGSEEVYTVQVYMVLITWCTWHTW